jgi:hypothetical protein
MRDEDERTALELGSQVFHQAGFGIGIHRRRRLIEDDDRRAADQCPRHRYRLSLTARKPFATVGEDEIVPARHARNEWMGKADLRSAQHLRLVEFLTA